MNVAGVAEYILTVSLIISFIGTLVAAVAARDHIKSALKGAGVKRWHLIIMIAIMLIFLLAELAIVKPTQQLFFDDAIYQGGALDLLHMGQAWMCNYGTPSYCYSGQIYHEPIGTAFNLAVGFLFFGVNLATAYNTMLALAVIAVMMVFFVGTMITKAPVAGLFSELLVALSPVLLVWARPTTSDLPMLTYSLIALFFMLVFVHKKSLATLAAVLFSISLLTYTKVDAVLYLLVIPAMYIVLDDKRITSSILKNFRMVRRNLLNTRVLLVILVFVIAITPEITYFYTELTTGNYGYQGTFVQKSCDSNFTSITPSSSINLQNFNANVCANVSYWFNAFKSQYIMQPIIFTLIAIAGAAAMMATMRRELLAIGIWFLAFFILYTSFYAGGVTYGVDWRFMLELAAQAGILGGYAAYIACTAGQLRRSRRPIYRAARFAVLAFVLFIIAYPIYAAAPLLAVSPSAIPQAGSARFYENFVYNSSRLIPPSCLVFSYDPTLFNINNRTSIQMFDLNPQSYESYKSQYGCLVLDYGYWCYTPNNTCTYVQSTFNLQSLANATYTPEGKLFGFFYITGIKNSPS